MKSFRRFSSDILFEDLEIVSREVIDRTEDWFRAFFKMDVMIRRCHGLEATHALCSSRTFRRGLRLGLGLGVKKLLVAIL